MGSIPACAGEPSSSAHPRSMNRVYPRVCGGTTNETETMAGRAGLSPRVRGNHERRLNRPSLIGSIPACAGEPFSSKCWSHRARVYPRVCGGTIFNVREHDFRLGLSPRVRGNHVVPSDTPPPIGSIPACAGEPAVPALAFLPNRVYPRVCGGTLTPANLNQVAVGLSPRVRGNRVVCRHRIARDGSIPACAGEPWC